MGTRSTFSVLFTVALASCNGNSPVGPEERQEPGPAPLYGLCDQHPNYASEVRLNRWRSFPLSYWFDAAAFPEEFRGDYHAAILEGISLWSEAAGNGLGRSVEAVRVEEADFVVTYRPLSPVESPARSFHETGDPFLSGGEIAFNPSGMREGEEFVRAGTIGRDTFLRGIRGIAAHEMGHLLGIIGHPRWTDVLMGPVFHDAPTTADLNTLFHAYCR